MRDPPNRFEIILYILGNFYGMIKIQNRQQHNIQKKRANQKPSKTDMQ